MDDQKRLKIKAALSTVLSDIGVLGKLPIGRIDWLMSKIGEWPAAITEVMNDYRHPPTKGSRLWNTCQNWALGLVVNVPEGQSRETRRLVKNQTCVWIDPDGVVQLASSFIIDLLEAGHEYATSLMDPDGDIEGVAPDLAEGMLVAEGIDPGSPGFRRLKDHAAELVAQGMQEVST